MENDSENDTYYQEDNDLPEVWYRKLDPLINNMKYVNSSLVPLLRTILPLDKMMILYMGNSTENHRMNNKPISEGFKFFP